MIMGQIKNLMQFLSVCAKVPHKWNFLGYFAKIVFSGCKQGIILNPKQDMGGLN